MLTFGLLAPWWWAHLSSPLPAFYKEWLFAVSIGASITLLGPRVHRISHVLRHPLAWAALGLAVVLSLQALFRESSAAPASMAMLYLGLFVTCLALGQRMRESRGDSSLTWLVSCLILGAMGSAALAGLQLNGVRLDPTFLQGIQGRRLTGNTAQANHFASLLWLGCLGVCYLYSQRMVRAPIAIVAVLLLLSFCGWTGSRMSVVLAAFAIVAGLGAWRFGTTPGVRCFAQALVLVGVLAPITSWSLDASGISNYFDVVSSAQRLGSETARESNNLRTWFFYAGSHAATHNPWAGIGPGNFAGYSLELAQGTAASPADAAEVNAHNLFLHVAAEWGIPAAVGLAASLAWWLFQMAARARHDHHALGILVLCGVILVHANVEYPLWYTYFLGLLGMIAGHAALPCDSRSAAGASKGRRWPPMYALSGIMVLSVAGVLYNQFRDLEGAMSEVATQVGIGAEPQHSEELLRRLDRIPKWSPLSPHAEAIHLLSALPTAGNAKALMSQCDAAIAQLPSPYLLARCAVVHQVGGSTARATHLANAVCRHPYRATLLAGGMQYVGRVSPEALKLTSSCLQVQNDPGPGRQR